MHGFHPYAEDGGVYLAGVEKLLNPALCPVLTAFVTEHLRFSVFAPLLAGLIHLTGVSLPVVTLALYILSLWSTLFAAWMVITRCVADTAGRCGAVTLLACWLTLPVAGTSLMLMDPYLTARSFTTPLGLFALAFAMDCQTGQSPAQRRRAAIWCGLAIAAAAALHPLMAGYTAAAITVLAVVGTHSMRIRTWGPIALCAAALAGAALLQWSAPPETLGSARAAMTRGYWFPARWEWYEQLGLAGPLLLLALLRRRRASRLWTTLITSALTLGAISLAVALVFSRTALANHLVARMQPLRSFQIVYELMILALGAWLAETVLRRQAWRWAALLLTMGSAMFLAERATFPASAHFEAPWRVPRNPWVQAFVWARDHTPADAVFALDAHYITRSGEDAQCFRAIAERSALPDFSKDGGEASITPDLANAWDQGQTAQTGLETEGDTERSHAIKPLGASWIVLERVSRTAWSCPYQNGTVKICRVP